MSEKLIFNCTHGKEDAERATLPFVAANIAATAGQDAVVLLHDRRGLARDGGRHRGHRIPWAAGPEDLFGEFVENGGQVWLCGACTKPRGIGEDDVAKGAAIVGAAKVVEEVVAGARTIAFAG